MQEQDTESLVDRLKESFIRRAHSGRGALTEKMLCDRFGVSRGTIREALQQLVQQGVIERRRKKGSYLRKPSMKELVDMWDVRSGMEATAIRIACSNITDKDIRKLQQLNKQREEAHERGDEAAVDEYDIAFHEYVITVANNTFIRDIIQGLHLFDRVFRIPYPVPSYSLKDESSSSGHQKIIDALEKRDVDTAEYIMKCHIQEGKKRRIEALIGKIDLFEE